MRRLLILFTVTTFLACSKRDNNNSVENSSLPLTKKDSSITKSTYRDDVSNKDYLTSTYDNPGDDLKSHRTDLKELSDSNVFSIIHAKLFSTLNKKHQAYFTSRADYELLYSTPGDLFKNNKEDNAFVVYDKKYSRVSILIYNGSNDTYSELFRDIKVRDGLETADCNYGSFGTLDYQIGYELIYHRDYLIKKPESHVENSTCKIVDITEDEDFILESGCFAKGFSSGNKSKSLCIPTSSVYNNWECLMYDKSNDTFIIFYGQAFAD